MALTLTRRADRRGEVGRGAQRAARARGSTPRGCTCPAIGSCSSRARESARVSAAMASMSTPPGWSTVTRSTPPVYSRSYELEVEVGDEGFDEGADALAVHSWRSPPLADSGCGVGTLSGSGRNWPGRINETKGVGQAHAFVPNSERIASTRV